MYGFGRGRGGRGGGYWFGLGRAWPTGINPSGYTYIGPCRCGFGPHAFYQDASGRILPAAAVFSGPAPTQPEATPESTRAEIDELKAEKAEIERRLRDLEARLQRKG